MSKDSEQLSPGNILGREIGIRTNPIILGTIIFTLQVGDKVKPNFQQCAQWFNKRNLEELTEKEVIGGDRLQRRFVVLIGVGQCKLVDEEFIELEAFK